MIIESKNGTGSIVLTSQNSNIEHCAQLLVDWINIDFIESVTIDTPFDAAKDEGLAIICNELFESTEKFQSLVVFANFSLVRLSLQPRR